MELEHSGQALQPTSLDSGWQVAIRAQGNAKCTYCIKKELSSIFIHKGAIYNIFKQNNFSLQDFLEQQSIRVKLSRETEIIDGYDKSLAIHIVLSRTFSLP